MKVGVLYNLVERPTEGGYMPANWSDVVRRFSEAYREVDAGLPHQLLVCTSGGPLSESSREILAGLPFETLQYMGGGWDIGAYQWSARRLQHYDLLVCMNTQAFPVRDGWLLQMAEAWERFGPGVYGTASSFEVAPHIRTSCIASSPQLLVDYAPFVRSRHDACVFEHSPRNFSLWALQRGLSVRLVTATGATPLMSSRRPPEVFRKGGQGDLLVHDRHTLLYDSAAPEERQRLQALADGKFPTRFTELGVIDQLCERHRMLKRLRAGLRTVLR